MVGEEANTIAKLLSFFNVLRGNHNHTTLSSGSDELPHSALLAYSHTVRGGI